MNKSFGPAPRGASTVLPAPALPGRAGPHRAAWTCFQASFPSRTAPRRGSAAPRGAAQEGRDCPGGRKGLPTGNERTAAATTAATATPPHPPPRPTRCLTRCSRGRSRPCPGSQSAAGSAPPRPIRGRLGAALANHGPGGGRGRRDVARAAGVRRYPAGAEPAAGGGAAPRAVT